MLPFPIAGNHSSRDKGPNQDNFTNETVIVLLATGRRAKRNLRRCPSGTADRVVYVKTRIGACDVC